MSHHLRNPLGIAAPIAIVLVALLVPASGAFASTLSSDGTTVTFNADAAGGAQLLELDELNTDELTIYTGDDPVLYDDDGDSTSVIDDSGADCVDAAGDNMSPATQVTCPDIDRIVANTNTGDDFVDASGCCIGTIASLVQIRATLNGGIGEDGLHSGAGADDLSGGSGDDEINGNDGGDVLRGGDDDDRLFPGDGDDDSDGEAGNDRVFEGDDGGVDLALGGTGADTLDYDACQFGCSGDDDLNINENGVEDDGDTEDDPDNRFDEFENIDIDDPVHVDARATVLSTNGNDSIQGGPETDVFTPRAGVDRVDMFDNDDTANTVDGFPDVVNCGAGDDTANADQFDELNGCENQNITQVPSAFDNPDSPDDLPPSVAFSNLNPNQFLPPIGTNLEATASDDNGVAGVIFFDGTKRLCGDATPPYTCHWAQTSDDVGENVLVVYAVDAVGQIGIDSRTVTVGKFDPDELEAQATKRDLNGPRRTRVRGMLDLPSGVSTEDGCEGEVRVRILDGTDRIRQRLVPVQEDCDYSHRFRLPGIAKLEHENVRIKTKFKGNDVLKKKKGDVVKTKVQEL